MWRKRKKEGGLPAVVAELGLHTGRAVGVEECVEQEGGHGTREREGEEGGKKGTHVNGAECQAWDY